MRDIGDERTRPGRSDIGTRPERAHMGVPARRTRSLRVCCALVIAVAACVRPAPVDVVDAYQQAFASNDLETLVALFTPFTVVSGHPLDGGDVSGLAAIRLLEEQALAWARPDDPLRFDDVRVSGDSVTFDQVIYGADGGCISGRQNRIVVDTGKILRWEWGSEQMSCG